MKTTQNPENSEIRKAGKSKIRAKPLTPKKKRKSEAFTKIPKSKKVGNPKIRKTNNYKKRQTRENLKNANRKNWQKYPNP